MEPLDKALQKRVWSRVMAAPCTPGTCRCPRQPESQPEPCPPADVPVPLPLAAAPRPHVHPGGPQINWPLLLLLLLLIR